MLKPCLHPVVSPSGEVITRNYPFKKIEGESTDHPHHTGLYFTYGSKGEVNGNSFWNMHDAPPQIVLQPGEKALFKFRVVVYEGEQEKQEFIEEFEEYSKLQNSKF